MKNLLLAIFLGFTGCGMDLEQEKKADCEQDKTTCEASEQDANTAQPSEGQDQHGRIASLDRNSGTSISVDVKVDVNVGDSGQGPCSEDCGIPFILANARMTWAEAISNAPAGYHVPTKLELAQILDENDIYFEGYDEAVEYESPKMAWTFSKSSEVASWATDLKDGSNHSYDRMVYLNVIYIGDAK